MSRTRTLVALVAGAMVVLASGCGSPSDVPGTAVSGSAAGAAWTTVTPTPVGGRPSIVRTATGRHLLADMDAGGKLIEFVQKGNPPQTLINWSSVTSPVLLQRGDRLLVYFAGKETPEKPMRVHRLLSNDGGAHWSAPVPTASTVPEFVGSGALRADGTPLFSQRVEGSALHVFQGLDGTKTTNIDSHGGYGASLAVDSNGLAQIAYWRGNDYVVQVLDTALTSRETLRVRDPGGVLRYDNVPLAVDTGGNAYLAVSTGTLGGARRLVLLRLRNGEATQKTLVRESTAFGNGWSEPHMAVATEGAFVWVAWTEGGSVWAARSSNGGASFGPPVSVPLPGSLSFSHLLATAGGGKLDVFVTTQAIGGGFTFSTKQLLPG